MFQLDIATVLQNIMRQIPFVRNLFDGRRQNNARNNGRGGLGQDEFVRAGVPLIGELTSQPAPNAGVLGGIEAALKYISSVYGASAGNSNPMFRLSIANWAIGALTSLAAQVENLLSNEAIKNTPLGQAAQRLHGVIKGVLSLVGGFPEEHKQRMESNMRISKSMNEPAKGVF